MNREKWKFPVLPADVTELEVHRAARAMIGFFPDDAGVEAVRQADEFYQDGDLNGFRVWRHIAKAIDRLQKTAAAVD